MDVLSPYRIDLEAAVREAKLLTLNANNDFFAALDQQEILGGDLNVTIGVKLMSGGIFRLSIEAEGTVSVVCDRCLEPVELEVSAHDERDVASFDAIEPPVDMVSVNRDGTYDTTWDVYETVVLSLPIQRTHEEGACNPEMLDILSAISADMPTEED